MTVQLLANMLNLENKLRPFPIAEDKIPFSLDSTIDDKQNFKIYKQLRSKTRQTDISEFFR